MSPEELLAALDRSAEYEAIFYINNGVNIHCENREEETALHIASKHNLVCAVKLLLDKGADVNAVDQWHNTPLMLSLKWASTECTDVLLSKGADINVTDIEGNSCLHIAAKHGLDCLVNNLISKGADVNAQNKGRQTAILCAVKNKHETTARCLVENGANVFVEPVFEKAVINKMVVLLRTIIDQHKESDTFQKIIDIINELLYTKGRQFNENDHFYHLLTEYDYKPEQLNDFLLFAVEKGLLDRALYFIERGADINHTDKDGKSMVHISVEKEFLHITKLFVLKGAKTDTKDKFWGSPLGSALRGRNSSEYALLVIKGGLSVETLNSTAKLDKKPPLDIAIDKYWWNVVCALLESGATDHLQDSFSMYEFHRSLYSGVGDFHRDIRTLNEDVIIRYHESDYQSERYWDRTDYSRNILWKWLFALASNSPDEIVLNYKDKWRLKDPFFPREECRFCKRYVFPIGEYNGHGRECPLYIRLEHEHSCKRDKIYMSSKRRAVEDIGLEMFLKSLFLAEQDGIKLFEKEEGFIDSISEREDRGLTETRLQSGKIRPKSELLQDYHDFKDLSKKEEGFIDSISESEDRGLTETRLQSGKIRPKSKSELLQDYHDFKDPSKKTYSRSESADSGMMKITYHSGEIKPKLKSLQDSDDVQNRFKNKQSFTDDSNVSSTSRIRKTKYHSSKHEPLQNILYYTKAGYTSKTDVFQSSLDREEYKDVMLLHRCVLQNENGIAALQLILEKHENTVDVMGDIGWTPLHLAIALQNFKAINILLEHGADINITTKCILPMFIINIILNEYIDERLQNIRYVSFYSMHKGMTALQLATYQNSSLKIMQELLHYPQPIADDDIKSCLELSFGEPTERIILQCLCTRAEQQYKDLDLKVTAGYVMKPRLQRVLLGLSTKVYRRVEKTFMSLQLIIQNPEMIRSHDFLLQKLSAEQSKSYRNQPSEQKPLTIAQAETCKSAISQVDDVLWRNYSNLNAITASLIDDKPTLILFCEQKGFIPIKDTPFMTNVPMNDGNKLRVRVRNGTFRFGTGKKTVKVGTSVGIEGQMGYGTVGPIIELPENERTDENGNEFTAFITCSHVFYSPKELTERDFSKSKGIKVHVPSDEQYANEEHVLSDEQYENEEKPMDVEDSNSTNDQNDQACDETSQVKGSIRQSVFTYHQPLPQGNTFSSQVSRVNNLPEVDVDATLVKTEICPSSKGLLARVYKSDKALVGFPGNMQLRFHTGEILNPDSGCKYGVKVFKIGHTTRLTAGVLDFYDGQVKVTDESKENEMGFVTENSPKVIMKGQMIVKRIGKRNFFQLGDSGSAVFAYSESKKTLQCIGMAIGYLENADDDVVVTPISEILTALGKDYHGPSMDADLKLKTFESE